MACDAYITKSEWGLLGVSICGGFLVGHTEKSDYRIRLPQRTGVFDLKRVEIYSVASNHREERCFKDDHSIGTIELLQDRLIVRLFYRYQGEEIDYINGTYRMAHYASSP